MYTPENANTGGAFTPDSFAATMIAYTIVVPGSIAVANAATDLKAVAIDDAFPMRMHVYAKLSTTEYLAIPLAYGRPYTASESDVCEIFNEGDDKLSCKWLGYSLDGVLEVG